MTERVKILQGERVALALIEKEDSLLRYRHMNDLEVQQFLSVGGCLLYKEAEQDYYDHIIKNPNMRVFAICVEGKKNIGNVSLEINRKNRNAELGIAIFDKNYWSQGYGTESIQLLFKYAFEILGLHKVYLNVVANNARAA
ncbi:N-acetyltransferase, partial [Candidatus Gracilibacteria bacterium]